MSGQVVLLRNAQVLSAGVENRVEGPVNDALRSDVHPAAGGHLSIVGHTHFFCDFPILQIIVFSDHQSVSDDDAGRVRFGGEQPQRISGLYDQRLLLRQFLQIFLDQPVLKPVLADGSSLAVGDQLIGIQSHLEIQIVIDHDLEGLPGQTLSLIFIDGLSVDSAFRTITVRIYTAVCCQFFHELRRQLLVQLFRHITQSVLQRDFRLRLSKPESPVRRSPDSLLKFRIIGIFISQLNFHCTFYLIVIKHIRRLLFQCNLFFHSLQQAVVFNHLIEFHQLVVHDHILIDGI